MGRGMRFDLVNLPYNQPVPEWEPRCRRGPFGAEATSVPLGDWLRLNQQHAGYGGAGVPIHAVGAAAERKALLCDEDGDLARLTLPRYIRAEQRRTRTLLVAVLCLFVFAAVVFSMLGYILYRAQTNVAWLESTIGPNVREMLNISMGIARDAGATMGHIHSASESGERVATLGGGDILGAINSTSRLVARMQKLMHKPTLQLSLQDPG
jgi:hypothetical protein